MTKGSWEASMPLPDYVQEVGIGLPDGTVTSTVHQGRIVSIASETFPGYKPQTNLHSLAWQYYLGCIVGAFIGGWLADRTGRINGLVIGACFGLVGGALKAATQSSSFILVARVVTGLGTGGTHLSPNIGKFFLTCWSVRSSDG